MNGISIMGLLLFTILGKPLIGLFVTSPSDALYTYAMQYLLTSGCFLIPLSWIFLYRNVLQGIGLRIVPIIGGIIELLSRTTIILLLLKPLQYSCICLTNPITWSVTGFFLLLNYLRWKHSVKKR